MLKLIPKTFYDDHVGRELPAPPIVSKLSTKYLIDLNHPNVLDLKEDAQYYADDDSCPDMAPRGLKLAARTLLEKLNETA